jgi:hypothetical protein
MLALVFSLLLWSVGAWNGIPTGVQCTAEDLCFNFSYPHFDNVCVTVCQPGTVLQPVWIQQALLKQAYLSREMPLCYQQMAGSHNSAITLANGYGVLDPILTMYLQKLLPGQYIRTNNQWLSLTDQLNLGARFLELDTHWILGELRLAHCGGVDIGAIDDGK